MESSNSSSSHTKEGTGGTHFVQVKGMQFIAPQTPLARALFPREHCVGKPIDREPGERSTDSSNGRKPKGKPPSNLTLLLNQVCGSTSVTSFTDGHSVTIDEADSASGPSPSHRTYSQQPCQHGIPLSNKMSTSSVPTCLDYSEPEKCSIRSHRCMSSIELSELAPPSGSPYAFMLSKKEEIEHCTRDRLFTLKGTTAAQLCTVNTKDNSPIHRDTSASGWIESSNSQRRRRREEYTTAVMQDLCEIVADLFIAESKLLKPAVYGVFSSTESFTPDPKNQVVKTIHRFVSSLPPRYALSADTPSEVLLHMRLMSAARSDQGKVAVHIQKLSSDELAAGHAASLARDRENGDGVLRRITISCHDAAGLLEYISKLLASGGSRVLDADVMVSKEGIVLDRFVVEMTGRLRLDRLSNLLEDFLQDSYHHSLPTEPVADPLYVSEVDSRPTHTHFNKEMKQAVPLPEPLPASQTHLLQLQLKKSSPFPVAESVPKLNTTIVLTSNKEQDRDVKDGSRVSGSIRETNRKAEVIAEYQLQAYFEKVQAQKLGLDLPTAPSLNPGSGRVPEPRIVPLIPFDEIMLVETLGTGRVSTIYRAAWQTRDAGLAPTTSEHVKMVALKVAMINPSTRDTAHVDELRREADIAARLSHPGICELVGVAADHDCFCLAYEYCEGGSLLSLLSDPSRYYEYLPIALDIANAMAYLHSRNVIHRDLKPSNVLITRDQRAKVADFGMSIANRGQELTAETGTYRYMAPEVIRHESYSSNADVYSFGICLWQLVTREIPFAQMTPMQAAYAVAHGHRPTISASTPRRLQDIITSCWDHDSQRRPSFTYIAMALADYATMAFSPATVGTQTLQIATEMLAKVEGNSTVNVDISTLLLDESRPSSSSDSRRYENSDVGLDIE